MGIPTLIKTLTASGDSSLSFVDGTDDVVLDGTYDEYMFVCTDIGPATNIADFMWQVNATDDAGGGYDTSLITSTSFYAQLDESHGNAFLGYSTGQDLAQSSSFQKLTSNQGNASDESGAGILHLFSPASTTYVKHFYSRFNMYHQDNYTSAWFMSGYINDTTAIDEIQFKMSSGNFDGVIQLYGIS